MLIPHEAVHCAAAAIDKNLGVWGDISQCDFEDYYHCRFGLSAGVENYWIQFDTPEYATAFILRWM